MVLTGYWVLIPVRPGLSVTVLLRISTCKTWHLPLGRLHTFAARPHAARLATQAASTAFRPAFVAIAIRPSIGMARAHDAFDLAGTSRKSITLDRRNTPLARFGSRNSFVRDHVCHARFKPN
jgi:hypothetical protein